MAQKWATENRYNEGMSKLLALDFSTTSTGYALFDIKTKALLSYGLIQPRKVKKSQILCGLKGVVDKLEGLAADIRALVDSEKPARIVIEEINKGVSRHSQKTLDMGHGFMLKALYPYLGIVTFMDSDGKKGWRGPKHLNLVLTEEDKASNKRNKLLNKSIPKRSKNPKHPIYTKKDLCQRYVNKKYGLNFDVQAKESDSDICDAIGLGDVMVNLIK